jgi:hypothetical protein
VYLRMTELKNIIQAVQGFGQSHKMVNEVLIFADEEEYEQATFKYRSMHIVIDGARIPRSEGEPVYEVDINLMLVDKTLQDDKLAYVESVQENLFILGQLQDYLQQSFFEYDFSMSDVNLTPIISEEHNITGAETILTIRTDRDSYINEIDNG